MEAAVGQLREAEPVLRTNRLPALRTDEVSDFTGARCGDWSTLEWAGRAWLRRSGTCCSRRFMRFGRSAGWPDKAPKAGFGGKSRRPYRMIQNGQQEESLVPIAPNRIETLGITPAVRREILRRLATIESEYGVRILYACESGSRIAGRGTRSGSFPPLPTSHDCAVVAEPGLGRSLGDGEHVQRGHRAAGHRQVAGSSECRGRSGRPPRNGVI